MHFEPRLWQFTEGLRLRILGTTFIGLVAVGLGIARLALLEVGRNPYRFTWFWSVWPTATVVFFGTAIEPFVMYVDDGFGSVTSFVAAVHAAASNDYQEETKFDQVDKHDGALTRSCWQNTSSRRQPCRSSR